MARDNLELMRLMFENQFSTPDPFADIVEKYSNLKNYQPYDQNQSDLASQGEQGYRSTDQDLMTQAPEELPAELPAAPGPQAIKGGRAVPLRSGRSFVEGMVRRGWTPDEAAGAAGNVHVESGFKPEIKSRAPGENSYGLLQWNHNRLTGLQNMAQATGRDWLDPEVQMDWIHMERTGESTKYGGDDERAAYKRALAGGGSPGDIAARFGQFVERPQDISKSVAVRRAAAEQYAGLGQSGEDEFTRIVRRL